MAPKKRISDEAFPWAKKTIAGETPDPPKKKAVKRKIKSESARPEPVEPISLKDYSERTLFVLYKKDGTIVSVAGIAKKYLSQNSSPFSETDDFKTAELRVPLVMENNDLMEIHLNCKVVFIEGKQYLVRKQ